MTADADQEQDEPVVNGARGATRIPHDPSLALGAIVDPAAVSALAESAALEAAIDASAEELEAAVDLQRQLVSLDISLRGLGLPSDQLQALRDAAAEASKSIAAAAARHAVISTEKLRAIKDLRARRGSVGVQLESPVDLDRSVTRALPLAVDSIHMETEYFAACLGRDDAAAQMKTLQEMLSRSFQHSGFAENRQAATDAIAAVTGQLTAQRQDRAIAGTLVLTASCTHRNASVWSPLVLDLPKAINAWNRLTPGGIRIDADDPAALQELATRQWGPEAEPAFHVVSGVTFGSTFVGMIHVLREPTVASPQHLFNLAARLRPLMDVAGALGAASGRLGVDPQVLDSVRRSLLGASVAARCTLVVMGAIPPLDPSAEGTLTTTGLTTTNMTIPRQGTVVDVGTLLNAYARYVDLASRGSSGVPLNYYLRPVTARELAKLRLERLTMGSGDRAESTPQPTPGTTGSSPASPTPTTGADPSPQPTPSTTLTLRTPDGSPVSYARFRLLLGDGSSLDGMLNRDGTAHIHGLSPSETPTLLFPDLSADSASSGSSSQPSPPPSNATTRPASGPSEPSTEPASSGSSGATPAPTPGADPSPQPTPRATLTLRTPDGSPVPYARFRLLLGDGSSLDGMLNRDGTAHIHGLSPNETPTLLFPDLSAADSA